MPLLERFTASQFANPTGVGGLLVSAVMHRQNRPLYTATLAGLHLLGAETVLDVGCGYGYALGLLAKTHQGMMIGVDPSASVIGAAERHYRRNVREHRMAFQVGSAQQTLQPSGSIDKAYSVNTVYFWDDLAAGFAEIRRVLKPGGVFVNACYTRQTLDGMGHTAHGYRKYDPAELIGAANQAGFSAEATSVVDGLAFITMCTNPT